MKRKKRILILSGHGGRDVGAISPDGKTREVDITIPAASLLAMSLRLFGFEACLSRAGVLTKQEKLSINDRVNWANNIGADLLVSIHANACESHLAEGSEVLYYRSGKPLAELLAPAIAILPERDRGAKRRENLGVLKKTKMPAVLMELGFLDDSDTRDFDDREWMLEHWPEQIARASVVIRDYLRSLL